MTAPGRPRLWIAALACALGLLGLFSIPVLDRDEARFAQATAQMLETGDFVRIRFQDEARNKKPVGIHWLQAGSTALFSNAQARAIWTYRLPSVLALMLAGVFIFEAGRALDGRDRGWIAALIGVTSIVAVAEAHIAKTDAALMAACAALFAALCHVRRGVEDGARGDPGWAYGFWAALGIGVLIKGPVAPVLVVSTVIVFCLWERRAGWLRELRPVTGPPIAIMIAAPWLIAIGLATEGAFFADALGGDFGAKLTAGREGHGGPPGLYAALLPLTFWPGALLLPAGLALSVRDRGEWRSRLLLASIIPFWLLLELTPTKLPHYIAPLVPALAVTAAGAALRADHASFARKIGVVVYLFAGFLLVAAVAAAGAVFSDKDPAAFAAAVVAVAAFIALSEGVCRRALQGRPARAIRLAIISAGMLITCAFHFIAPKLDALWIARRVDDAMETAGAATPVAASGLSEPSLVFTLGTATRFMGAEEAARALARGEAATALIEATHADAFERFFDDAPFGVERFAEVSGLNYSKGDRVTLGLYRITPTPNPSNADEARP